jgi:bifunctional DNA-binding transcriptional regulator/antitoxin component of YhaV-PrlF toxin-antitoxin module
MIIAIDADPGTIQVYDPGDSGDSLISEWGNLTWDDYIEIFDPLDDSNTGEFRVSSSARAVLPGDTTIITLGDAITGGADQLTPGGYVFNVSKSKIKSIDESGGNVEVHDASRKFYGLVEGDIVEIYDTGDSNDGIHIVGNTVTHVRSGDGDTFGVTTFNVSTSLDHDSGDSGGTVRLNSALWTLGDSRHQNGFDFIEFTKMR